MEKEAPANERASGPSSIVISGDPLESRSLALLLQNSGYQAKFLLIASLNDPGALEDVQLLVLTPTWAVLSTEEHKALLSSLEEMPRDTGLIVMELITLSEERHTEEGAQEERPSHKKVPWPCGIDELEQRIEAALRTGAR
jgi:chromosome segregation and condensation protein ScpB